MRKTKCSLVLLPAHTLTGLRSLSKSYRAVAKRLKIVSILNMTSILTEGRLTLRLRSGAWKKPTSGESPPDVAGTFLANSTRVSTSDVRSV